VYSPPLSRIARAKCLCMFDQSCNPVTLSAVMRRGDFHKVPKPVREIFRDATVQAANQAASSHFEGLNPIKKFHLKKKASYRISTLANDLVVRKITFNLRRLIKRQISDRTRIVKNLCHFLEEGVPYKVYRLDIKSFYESFSLPEVKKQIDSVRKLPPQSKKLLNLLFDHYQSIGGVGLPRGMALSADLSDFLMADFDEWVIGSPVVYYYGRYVDDILVITNQSENQEDFLSQLSKKLPSGLRFNEKKTSVSFVDKKTEVQKGDRNGLKPKPKFKFSLDYLGYQFSIFDPASSTVARNDGCHRLVKIDIAPEKIAKIKRRIVRTFLDFYKTRDQGLLIDRIKYLTSNFYVVDKRTGKRQLSGIYYGYPVLSMNSESLAELDCFLRNAILSKRGRLFSKTAPMIDSKLKRTLLSHSFVTGHEAKRFVYFSLMKIGEIQRCWKYE
jgi:hypothetical protein